MIQSRTRYQSGQNQTGDDHRDEKSNRKRTGMKYNKFCDVFLIDKIESDEISELVNVGERGRADGQRRVADHQRQ